MAQPYIGSQGTTEYREALGGGTAASPYVPQFYLATLPAFAATPTFNLGTAPSLTFTNTAFNISGTLPAFANAPDVNIISCDTTLDISGSVTSRTPNYFKEVVVTKPSTTTNYALNRVYGNLFEIINIGTSGGFVNLTSISIVFNLSTMPSGMSDFALYLFNASPSTTFANNQSFSFPAANRTSMLTLNGINLTANLARGGGTVVAETILVNTTFKLLDNSTSLWGYLVSLNSFSDNSSGSFTMRFYAK